MCVDGCLCMVFRGIWDLLVGLLVTLVLLKDEPTFALFSVRFELQGTEMRVDRWCISLVWSWLLSILFGLGLRGSLILWV